MHLWRSQSDPASTDRERAVRPAIDDTFATLRVALAENAHDAQLSRVSSALQAVCRRARDEGVPPERLLILLKRTMNEVAGLDPRSVDEHDRRGRLVSMAIDAYFAER